MHFVESIFLGCTPIKLATTQDWALGSAEKKLVIVRYEKTSMWSCSCACTGSPDEICVNELLSQVELPSLKKVTTLPVRATTRTCTISKFACQIEEVSEYLVGHTVSCVNYRNYLQPVGDSC